MRGEMHPAFRKPRDTYGRDLDAKPDDFSDLICETKVPEHFTYTPNHFQRTQNISDNVVWEPHKPKEPEFNVTKPCFGLDVEREVLEVDEVATGYRVGGPKEARLFRVALLAAKKDVDDLYPVRVSGVHDMINEEELYAAFGQFGKIGDVYVPRKGSNRKLTAPYGVVRFIVKESAEKAVYHGEMILKTQFSGPDPYKVTMSHIPPQESIFTKNSGVHGITNTITEDMRVTERILNAKKEDVTQVITLDECFSRGGYPWGSKRELKMLNTHADKEVMHHYNIYITNLDKHSHETAIRAAFEVLNDITVSDVYAPMTLIIAERNKLHGTHSEGYAWVRFPTRHDLDIAWRAINLDLIKVDGRVIKGELKHPYSWPDAKRRYH
jgi:hypothetical protein